jgi:cysteine desulfurase family protein (TIGR01976 family)
MNTTPLFQPTSLRQQFPALQQEVNGRPAVFLDGPGGTQTPQAVIDAMVAYLQRDNSNSGGAFVTSRRSDEMVAAARQAAADLFNARRPEEIIFGQNMTSLTFAMSRAIARTWQPGDEIVVTRLDHDANISPWLLAAGERNVTVRWLDFRPEDCTLLLGELAGLLNEKTRLVAVSHASNAVGTVVDVGRVVQMAHQVGALVYVDAVHYAPHGPIDVQALDCDFLASSAYKYYGPHTGVLYGKYELLDSLEAYKVRPSSNTPPRKWETGTQSFESIAGVKAAIDYLATLGLADASAEDGGAEDGGGADGGAAAVGGYDGRRRELKQALHNIRKYEADISLRFLEKATAVPGLRVYGITDVERIDERTPTFAVSLAGYSPRQVAEKLGQEGIFVWDGHYYAVAVMERLGLLATGGLTRIGFVHYNTVAEVDRVIDALGNLSG